MLIVGIILGAISFIFMVQNLDTVSYNFLVWSISAPRFLVFVVILATGLILGWSIKAFAKKKNRK